VEVEGASLEEARSIADALHEWREGETVRERTFSNPVSREFGLRVSACRFSIRQKAFSDPRAVCPYGQGEARSSWLTGESRRRVPKRAASTREAHRAVNGDRLGRVCQ
jgi:hypothetical protein